MVFKRKKKVLLLILIPVFLIFLFFTYTNTYQELNQQKQDTLNLENEDIEISGWIAWWAEKSAFDLVSRNHKKIKSVSPVWYMLDEDMNLQEVGETNKQNEIEKLKENRIEIIPTIGSEYTGEKLSPFFESKIKKENLINEIVKEIVNLKVDGLDVDIEGISEKDKESYTNFLSELQKKLKENNLKMTIAVHAQNGKVDWEGVLGQDLKRIGEIVDEVRIMTYDQHSASSEAGPIAAFDWATSVVEYNLKYIPKEKIVMGIPSYGYIWPQNNDPKGLHYNEFLEYIRDNLNKNEASIDKESGEVVYKEKTFTGWLSNSNSMISKVENLRSLGINRFIIWHLGGMDERFFEKNWTN